MFNYKLLYEETQNLYFNIPDVFVQKLCHPRTHPTQQSEEPRGNTSIQLSAYVLMTPIVQKE